MVKDIKTPDKDKANDILGYWSVIGLASLVGLIGWFLFGVWDSITVIIDHGLPENNALREMLSLALYSVAIYTVIGCLGMTIIGVLSGIIIRTGRYHVSRLQLARILIVVFILLAVSGLLVGRFLFGNIIDIVESTVISILAGVGVAALIMYALTYVLNKGMKKEKLIAFCISLLVSILVLLYCGLFINLRLLDKEFYYQPISLVTNAGLVILVILIAIGLYALFMFIMRRYNTPVFRRAIRCWLYG